MHYGICSVRTKMYQNMSDMKRSTMTCCDISVFLFLKIATKTSQCYVIYEWENLSCTFLCSAGVNHA